MIINELFLHKIDHFINSRMVVKDFDYLTYKKDEPDLFLLAIKSVNGLCLPISRWMDVVSKRNIERIKKSLIMSDDDFFSFSIFISRLGYLFEIDLRQRTNKTIFIIYCLFQLSSGVSLDSPDKERYFYLRRLFFELGISDDIYERFFFDNGILFFKKDSGDVNRVCDVSCYLLSEIVKYQVQLSDTFEKLSNFIRSVVHGLFQGMGEKIVFNKNDPNAYLMSVCEFTDVYLKNKSKVFSALVDGVSKYQSSEELLVSNFIYLNYANKIVSKNPKAVYFLKKNIGDTTLFSKILSAIVCRGVFVRKSDFKNTNYYDDIVEQDRENIMLYNLIYTIEYS